MTRFPPPPKLPDGFGDEDDDDDLEAAVGNSDFPDLTQPKDSAGNSGVFAIDGAPEPSRGTTHRVAPPRPPPPKPKAAAAAKEESPTRDDDEASISSTLRAPVTPPPIPPRSLAPKNAGERSKSPPPPSMGPSEADDLSETTPSLDPTASTTLVDEIPESEPALTKPAPERGSEEVEVVTQQFRMSSEQLDLLRSIESPKLTSWQILVEQRRWPNAWRPDLSSTRTWVGLGAVGGLAIALLALTTLDAGPNRRLQATDAAPVAARTDRLTGTDDDVPDAVKAAIEIAAQGPAGETGDDLDADTVLAQAKAEETVEVDDEVDDELGELVVDDEIGETPEPSEAVDAPADAAAANVEAAASPQPPAKSKADTDASDASDESEDEDDATDEAELIRQAIDRRKIRSIDNLLVAGGSERKARNHARAIRYCEDKSIEGLRGWRLPTIAELTVMSESRLTRTRKYWSSVRGDPTGSRMLIWDGKRRRIVSVGRHWRKGWAVCVRSR